MSGAAREMDQADFDLERFVDMFDEALTSRDPRVIRTLRDLMMIVALTRPEARNPISDRNAGPLRRLFEDMNHLNRRLHDIEDTIRRMQRPAMEEKAYNWTAQEKYTMEAANLVAAQVDQDVLAQMRTAGINKAKGLK